MKAGTGTSSPGHAKIALILGISGQDGAYLAHLLLTKGYQVHGTSRDVGLRGFTGLDRLGIRDRVTLHSVALNDFRSVMMALDKVMPDEIYNLAGQTSVGLSFDQPVETFESIAVGTLNVLDCMRFIGAPTRLFNAASSECFGNTEAAATEATPFQPRSPYATAKAAAFWAIANYREAYGMFACSGILANHESPLRPSRFVTRKVIQSALRIAAGERLKLSLGNIRIARDWGWAPDYVVAFWRMLQSDQPQDYNVATGETHSLADFVAAAFEEQGLDWRDHVEVERTLFRPSEIMCSRISPAKAKAELGWEAHQRMRDVVRLLLACERDHSVGPLPWVAA